jgi:hypothetical protein
MQYRRPAAVANAPQQPRRATSCGGALTLLRAHPPTRPPQLEKENQRLRARLSESLEQVAALEQQLQLERRRREAQEQELQRAETAALEFRDTLQLGLQGTGGADQRAPQQPKPPQRDGWLSTLEERLLVRRWRPRRPAQPARRRPDRTGRTCLVLRGVAPPQQQPAAIPPPSSPSRPAPAPAGLRCQLHGAAGPARARRRRRVAAGCPLHRRHGRGQRGEGHGGGRAGRTRAGRRRHLAGSARLSTIEYFV